MRRRATSLRPARHPTLRVPQGSALIMMSRSDVKRSPAREQMWWRVAAFCIALPLFLLLSLSALSAANDAGRVPMELAVSKRESSVMLCSEGRVEHSDSFLGLLDGGYFRCTAWRMRQSAGETSTGPVAWPTSPRR